MARRRQGWFWVFFLLFYAGLTQPRGIGEEGAVGGDMQKTEAQWKADLTPEQHRVLRKKGTEPAFSGNLVHNKADGLYRCAACGTVLFDSTAKFDSGTGWPSFDEPAIAENILLQEDRSFLMKRMEVVCKTCKGHLGHLFNDGPTESGKRYCINSVALTFNDRPKTP